MLSLAEMWKISSVFYRNLGFVSLQEMRRGNTTSKTTEKLVRNASVSMLINKIFLTILFIVMATFTIVEHSVIVYASYFLFLTFLFAIFFLQVVTYFFQIRFDILRVLPVPREDEQKIMLLTFIRIFDLPLLANIVLFPIFVVVVNPWYSIIPSFLAVTLSEIFSLGIVTFLAGIFYEKLSSPIRGWKSVLRFVYQVIWGASFLLLYASVMFLQILYENINHYSPLIAQYSTLFKLIYPFDYSYLIVAPDFSSLISSILFIYLGYRVLRWVIHSIGTKHHVTEDAKPEIQVKVVSPLRGMMKKDFRIITRNPGLAMLLFLPAFEGIILMSIGKSSLISMGMVFTFEVVFLYTLFGFEKTAMVRTLPVSRGFVYVSKNVMGFIVFLISLFIMDSYLMFSVENADMALQLLLIPSIFAAGIFLLFIGDLLNIRKSVGFSALGFIVLIVVGDVVAFLPAFIVKFIPAGAYTLPSGIFLSLVELLLSVIVVIKVQ